MLLYVRRHMVAAAFLFAFKEKLQKDTTVPPDALDIVKDLYAKVRENKPIPNYLSEGLKESLKDHPGYLGELEELLKLLKGDEK